MVEAKEHGKVVGRLYYLRKNRCGIHSTMPPFTHFLGPAIDPGTGNPLTRHLKTLSITADLIEKLPAFRRVPAEDASRDHRRRRLSGSQFETLVQFTYEIPPDE